MNGKGAASGEGTDALRELPPPAPRLRIPHLMLWTGLSAVMLVLMQTRRMSMLSPSAFTVVLWVFPVAAAAALTVLILRWTWRGGGRWLLEPGHGLALLSVGGVLAWAPSLFVWTLYLSPGPGGAPSFNASELPTAALLTLQYGHLVGQLLLAMVAVVLAVRLAKSALWRVVFVAIPLLGLLGSFWVQLIAMRWLASSVARLAESGAWQLLTSIDEYLVLMLIALACVRDRTARHWTHWWGVVAFVAPSVALLVASLIAMAISAG